MADASPKPIQFELQRAEFRQIRDIDQVKQTFSARVALVFKIGAAATERRLRERVT